MTDYIELLKADLELGYSKSDLERLIGLPRNNLTGILKGDKNLSKKSQKKIEVWEASNKPDPLKLHFVKKEVKIVDANKATNIVEPVKPMGIQKSNFVINTQDRLPGETSLEYKIRMA